MSSESAVQNIQKKLASLRRNIRLCLLLEGVSYLLLAAFTFLFLSFVIDFFGHMDLAQRALMLILGITALTVVALRRILHPLMNTVSDDGLCLEIEQRHKELQDGLITAIQLARIDDTRSYFSPAMVNNAIRAGTAAAEQVNFEDILDRERRNRHLFLGIGIMATFILVFLLSPSNISLWFQRNIFLQPVQWPRETTLFVMDSKNGKLTVPEGADLNLRVKADPDGVIPAEVEAHTRPAAGRHVRTSPMSRVNNNSFRLTFESVQEPFELRVRGNDHKTQWYKVRLLERPRLEWLQLTVLPPEYVGQEEIALPPGQSAYRILTGSALKMEAFSQKQLQQGKLMRGEKTIADLTLEGKKHFTITIPGKNLKGGRYSIDLTDIFDMGIDRPMQFVLRIRPDRKPDVRAKLEGIGNMILPRATLPLNARFKDDYAITNAWLLCQADTGNKQHKEKRLKLGGLAEKIAQDKPEIRHECRVDISQMNLEPENHLLLRVQATDNDTISGPKIGDSSVLSLRVVTPEALRAEILRREQDLHQQFKRILNDQKDLHETCRILQANIRKGQKSGGDESVPP
ncbi:MAG: hypothetical protein KGZ25_09340, partial [Planctomycetes bacterium]|nr:hypothetical protein [Planctomycetota bacterium]